ncbi:MAG: NINE protein [Pseudomonadota bacterium]
MKEKSLVVAYIWWILLGLIGAHRFYVRDYGVGFVYLFTLGLLGVGWLVDFLLLPGRVKAANLDYYDTNEAIRYALEDRIEELEDEIDLLHEKLNRRAR